MKLRWFGALVITLAPLACSLVVDTSNLSGGLRDDDGGSSSGNGGDGNVATGDALSSSGNVDDASGGDTGLLGDSSPPIDAPPPRFCSTIKPSLKLQFCDDFDDDNRSTVFANGWTLLAGSAGADEKSGLSLASEPAASKPRAARIVQDIASGHPRTRASHAVNQGKDFSLHFKYNRTSQTDGPVIAILRSDTCTVAVTASDVFSYCPDYAVIYDLPDMPENTWNEMTITIEEHSPTSRFFISAPNVSKQRVDVPPVVFNTLELGQDTNDATQTVFYDDVWVEGNGD